MMEMWWFIVGDGSLLEMAHCWRCGVCCWRCGGSLICSICGCGGSLRRRGGLFWRCGVSLGKCGAWLIDGDVMMSPGLGPVKDDKHDDGNLDHGVDNSHTTRRTQEGRGVNNELVSKLLEIFLLPTIVLLRYDEAYCTKQQHVFAKISRN